MGSSLKDSYCVESGGISISSLTYSVFTLFVHAIQSVVQSTFVLIHEFLKLFGIWSIFIYLIEHHRSWIVILFVLPLSKLFDYLFILRHYIIYTFYSSPKLHKSRVLDIQSQIKTAISTSRSSKLCTARAGWLSISMSYRKYKQSSTQINIDLYDILSTEIDPFVTNPSDSISSDDTYGVVWVEPLVTMAQLSAFLISKGYTLPILPEMDDLTVGGLLMGVGIETSGHKYGLLNDLVVEYEMVLGNGERVLVTDSNAYSDLYHALPWSYGTLGFLVSVKLKVVKCKQFVRMRYYPCNKSLKQGCETFESFCAQDEDTAADFVESLVYSKDSMVVMTGKMVDSVPKHGILNEIGRFYKPWFYKHVQSMFDRVLKQKNSPLYVEEYIPLRDYYHRHTKSIFWELEDIIPVGNQAWFRYLLGWLVPPKVAFLKLTTTESMTKMYDQVHVAQDMLLPMKDLEMHLNVFDEVLGIYPLWLCPHRHYVSGNRAFLRDPLNATKVGKNGRKYEMYVDIGAYGVVRDAREKKHVDMKSKMRQLEHYVLTQNGFQMLYADIYQTKDEFELMFDHKHYKAMREKYRATGAFGVVYDKMAVKLK